MNIRFYWESFERFWRGKVTSYMGNFRRLIVASRPTAALSVILGITIGIIPLAGMIVLFRLVDAVTGARAVRVITSDLHQSLVTLGTVWLVAIIAWMLLGWLQGLTRKMTEQTAEIVFIGSVLTAIFTIAPFRAVLIAAVYLVLHPWIHSRTVRSACIAVHTLVSYALLSTVTAYLLSRSISVGSYVLFLGAIFGALTMTIVQALRQQRI